MFNSRKARILALAEQQKQQIARENQEQNIVNGSSNKSVRPRFMKRHTRMRKKT